MTELPTTPGRYYDKDGDPWELRSDGVWYIDPDSEDAPEYRTTDSWDLGALHAYGPYTPVEGAAPNWRKKVREILFDMSAGLITRGQAEDRIMAVFA